MHSRAFFHESSPFQSELFRLPLLDHVEDINYLLPDSLPESIRLDTKHKKKKKKRVPAAAHLYVRVYIATYKGQPLVGKFLQGIDISRRLS